MAPGRGSITSDREDEFLSHLPPDTPIIHYDPQLNLESLVPPNSLPYDYFVVIKAFPSDLLGKLDEKLPGRIDYSFSSQTLILKMSAEPHEQAADRFGILLGHLAIQMNVFRRINCMASTLVRGHDRAKQADRAWLPEPRQQEKQIPTVALEVGYSQTSAKLENDIKWWLNEANGRMKMGITIDIKRGSGNIEIKSWVPTRPFPRHAYITAHQRQVVDRYYDQQPQVSQRILVKKGKNGQPPTITGGDLVIPFKYLFLIEPGEGEGDFIFTEDMLLHDIADFVWRGIEIGEEEEKKRLRKK